MARTSTTLRSASCALFILGFLTVTGCVPKAPAVTPQVPTIGWDEKLAWMVRLEDQRLLREPNPPPQAVLRPATDRLPAIVAPAQPSDLVRLLGDPEARVRRRAALALGRVGLSEAVEPLVVALGDAEPEVRQMAAFALGLLGSPSARPGLLSALATADPLVQGRAAQALGLIGDKADAAAIGQMVQARLAAGAFAEIEADDVVTMPSQAGEAARLGLFALARLAAYEPLAAAVLDAQGLPVSRWWPVAYALQRVADARAAPALTALVATPGRYTASFAVRGLAAVKATQALPTLRGLVEPRTADPAVVVQAIRALAALGDRESLPLLTKILSDRLAPVPFRLEAMAAFGELADAGAADILVELVSDPMPAVRATAMRALARVAPDTFTATLSGLDPDPDWTVRAAQAGALGTLPDGQGLARLAVMADDRDVRVVPAVLAALAASNAPGAEAIVRARLGATDFMARAAAARGLAEMKVASAVPALREAYGAAATDTTYVARAALLDALARLDPEGSRSLLQGALKDPEWAVRVRAADLLREQGVTDGVAEAMRPATAGQPVDSASWRAIVAPAFSPHALIETDKGTIEIELAVLDAPLTVNNFINLARKGFFNGLAIHRVVFDFVVQGGDPRGDGEGGPGFAIRDEINELSYTRGTVGMALDWRDTGGSQFFITHSPAPHLDARYTVFGQVVDGMEVVDRIVPWDVIRRVRIRDGVNPE